MEASENAPAIGHNGVPPALFLEFYRQIRREKRLVDEANGKYRATRKRAEAAGVDLKALALMENLAKLDEGEAAARLKTALRYSGWADIKIGQQPGLFDAAMDDQAVPEKAAAEWREGVAEEAGYDAGKGGQNRDDNPYPVGTPHAAAWDRGWCSGQAVIAAEMGPEGARPKKGSRRRKGNPEGGPQA